MQQKITLTEYLRLGGKLENVDWSKAEATYSDKNYGKEIILCEDRSEGNEYGEILLHVTFKNGVVHRYNAMWIIVLIEFNLSQKYTK